MNRTFSNVFKRFSLLALLVLAALMLGGCGDNEGDIVSPVILPYADNAYFTTSTDITLRVETETGAVVEVSVAAPLTATTPEIDTQTAASGADLTVWKFTVSGLQPGTTYIPAIAKDPSDNQRVIYLPVTYDFLAIDRLVTPVARATTGYEVKGTVADGMLPVVKLIYSAGDPLVETEIIVTPVAGATTQQWVATFDLPDLNNLFTITVNRNDGTNDVTKSFAITGSDADFPLATIDSQPFEISESGDPANRNITLSGTRLTDATVLLKLNNVEVETVEFPTPDSWSALVTLRPGKNFITLAVTDETDPLLPLTTTAYDAIWYLLP